MQSRALVEPTPGWVVLAALCALSALPAAAQDGGGCAKDTECKGSRLCVNRVCVDPPPVLAPSPVETPTVLILASPPPPVAPPPATATVPAATTPAFTPTAPANTAAAPAAAGGAPIIRRVEETPGFSPTWLYSAGAQAGLHLWRSNPAVTYCPHTTSPPPCYEGDFGLALSGEAGLRLSDHFGVLLLGAGSWTLMVSSEASGSTPASSHNGLLASVGFGVRADHLGALPGHLTLGGTGTFGAILSGADKIATIDLSGASALLDYALPLNGSLQADGRLAWHFLNKDLSLLVLSVGISFGN